MSLKPQGIRPVPEETARGARAASPKGKGSRHLRDALGPIAEEESFADVCSVTGQPAEAPWRCALVTIMPIAEGRSDRHAADAVRGRMAVNAARRLDLSDPGVDASMVSEFRTRLIAGPAEEHVLTALLTLFKERGWLKARGNQRTASTPVLATIRALTRRGCAGETRRQALNGLAMVAPEWLLEHRRPEGVERDGVRLEDSRLPSGEEERQAWARGVGHDGNAWLRALFDPHAPSWVRDRASGHLVRRVWVPKDPWSEGKRCWRSSEPMPPAAPSSRSPDDLDAHDRKKRPTRWVGFQVHLTDTCEQDRPHLLTPVDTTTAPVSDDARTATLPE